MFTCLAASNSALQSVDVRGSSLAATVFLLSQRIRSDVAPGTRWALETLSHITSEHNGLFPSPQFGQNSATAAIAGHCCSASSPFVVIGCRTIPCEGGLERSSATDSPDRLFPRPKVIAAQRPCTVYADHRPTRLPFRRLGVLPDVTASNGKRLACSREATS